MVPWTRMSGPKTKKGAKTKRHRKAEEGVRTPLTASSEAKQAAGAAAPQTGSSGDKWRPDPPDRIIRDGTSSRSRRPPDCNVRGQAAA